MRSFVLLLALLAASLGIQNSAAAEPAVAPVVAQVPAGQAPPSNVTSSRSFFFDYALLVVLFGAAMFAVCRSSNRS